MFSSGGRRWLLASPLGTGNLTRLLWCITRGVEELACRVAPQGNRHRCEFSRRKPHALPPSQILFCIIAILALERGPYYSIVTLQTSLCALAAPPTTSSRNH